MSRGRLSTTCSCRLFLAQPREIVRTLKVNCPPLLCAAGRPNTLPPGGILDPERARTLLVRRGPGGKASARGVLHNSSEAHRTIAETVQRMWRENLHVDARLLNQDWKTYLSSMNTLDYQVARSSWIGDVADAVNFLECFQTDVGNNRTGWSSPKFDALIAGAYREADIGKRAALLREAEELLLDESPIVPVYFYTWKFLMAPEVKGLKPNILGYLRWKELYLDYGEE